LELRCFQASKLKALAFSWECECQNKVVLIAGAIAARLIDENGGGRVKKMIVQVTRRMCVATLGATVLPVTAHAQRPASPTIGILDSSAANAAKLTAFYEGLKVEGFVQNQNLAVQYHSAEGDYSRLPGLAADLVGRQVSLISALGAPAALAAKGATTTVPIVIAMGPNPVSLGLVANLNRPGVNLTGVTSLAAGREQKRLELLHEVLPTAPGFGVLVNSQNSNADAQIHDALVAAQAIGVQIKLVRASSQEFGSVFTELAKAQTSGLVIADDDFFLSASAALGSLAARYRIPAIFEGSVFTAAGGLMSYGSRLTELYHQAGVWSGLVLKGAVPGELGIYQSQGIDLVVNLRSAKFLGIEVPQGIIDRSNALIK
jgi:putative ABC transport system substrate-binding protein